MGAVGVRDVARDPASAIGASRFFGSAFGATPPFSLRTRLPARTTVGLAAVARPTVAKPAMSSAMTNVSASCLLHDLAFPEQHMETTPSPVPVAAWAERAIVSGLTSLRSKPVAPC